MSLLYTTGRFVHALRPEILRAYLEHVMPELIPVAGKDGADAAAYLEQLPEEERRRFDSAAADLYMLWQEPDILQREEELPDHIRAALPGEYAAYSVAERIV